MGDNEHRYTNGTKTFGWVQYEIGLTNPWCVCNELTAHGKWFSTLKEAKQWLREDLKALGDTLYRLTGKPE